MDEALVAALDRLNRRFYDASAREFDATRQAPWPGFEEVGRQLTASRADRITLLDLGCGNGRFARFLAARCGIESVVGIDASHALLATARAMPLACSTTHWIATDLAMDLPLREDLRFDCVALFGVMHHVPTFERRRTLLERALARVSRGGLLVVTFWQIEGEESIASRMLPSQAVAELLRAEIGSNARSTALEERDHIVTFGAKRVPRYVHECDAAERRNLLGGLPARCVAEFESDGRNGRGNVYVLLTPEA